MKSTGVLERAESLAVLHTDVSSHNDAYWRSLRYFSYYRLVVAGVLLGISLIFTSNLGVASQNPRLFVWTCLAYIGLGMVCLVVLKRWPRRFNMQLSLQVLVDVVALTLMLFASGGASSGLATMMLVVLVGAGLVGQGRLVLFYAALATLALLIEQAYRVFAYQGDAGDFFRTGLTSIGFFGSALAARLLAQRVVANEELARKRGIDLADQLRINERVIRDMQDGVLVIDALGQVRQANPQAAELCGFAGSLPRALSDYSPVLAREFAARRNQGYESEMVLPVAPSGRTLRARFLPPGDGGNVLIFIEDLGRLQQEAQQAKLAALGRLTANMAHEIRNPLAAISHAAELLDEDRADEADGRLVRIIGDNAQRLNRLVSEVMELGRRDRAMPEAIMLPEFLRGVVDELSLRNPALAQRVRIDIPEGLACLFDRGHLHRVIVNLLGNAARYASERPGSIVITGFADLPKALAELAVVDDGPGIDGNDRIRVFEPFFTTRAGGTGLGLYIARELCEANRARLSLRENAPGAHFSLSCVLAGREASQGTFLQ